MTGTVVFSLDFELGWGHTNVRPEYVSRLREESQEDFEQIRALINLFDEYELPATWATVGKLTEHGEDPLFHNPELFEYLLNTTVDHEIGLHSYEHLPYTEISKERAKKDLRSGVEALEEWDITGHSFIHPQGLIDHVELLPKYDFNCYRSKRLLSKLDSLNELIYPSVIQSGAIAGVDEPVAIPETRFVAAQRPLWFRRWILRRTVQRAADNESIVHLWLHPHNVITQDNLLLLLSEIFEHVCELREKNNIRCLPMAALAK